MSNASQIKNIAIGATVLAAGSAQADLKLVVETSVGRSKASTVSQKATTYVKGNLVRTDARGRYQILDTKTNKVITVDPAAKTYTVREGQALGKLASSRMASTNVKAKVSAKSGGKAIAGRTTKGYVGTMSMTASAGTQSRTMKIEFEQWVDPTLKSANLANEFGKFLDAMQSAPNFAATRKELSKIQGLPLASTTTVRDEKGNVLSVTSSKALSVSQTTLPSSLFEVPKGYREVKFSMPSLANLKQAGHRGHDH